MKKEFELIFSFFEKKNLSKSDIIKFEKELELIYSDYKSFQLAKAIFKLQLVNYNSRNTIIKEFRKNEEINNSAKKKKKPINVIKTTINKNRTILYLLNQLTDENIKEIFLNLLRTNGIYKGRISYELSDSEYKTIEKDYSILLLNCKKNEEIPKTKKSIKKHKRSNLKAKSSVYEKLLNTKSIGKFINIRTK